MAITNLNYGSLASPTQQKFTITGSGTYYTPPNCLYIRVRMVGGGGGGAGGGGGSAGSGGSGGNTTFGSSLLTANGGTGGAPAATSGVAGGGGATINSPAYGSALGGGAGSGGNSYLVAGYAAGMSGGVNPLGGAGASAANAAGGAAATNSGAGGGGGGSNQSGGGTGGGGGAGGYIEAIIPSPSTTYSYSIGTGGTAGTAGTNGFVGGAGGSGVIIVDEFYTFTGGVSSGTTVVGSGLKNYLASVTTSNGANSLSGNFEGGSTASFSLANTALSSQLAPTSVASAGIEFSSSNGGTNANANLSLSSTGANQLTGLYSALLSSSASSTAGNMLVSKAFYIDKSDQAKILQISFNYSVISGGTNLVLSGTSTNSFAIWAYDVTNAVWIQPAGVYNITQGTGVGTCTATFQTTSNSTQYQIALINVNATSGAYTLALDEFSVGPQIKSIGPAMSDWQSYTPAFTASTVNPSLGSGGNFNQQGRWRRVGDTMQVQVSLTWGTSGTSFGTGTYRIGLPSGYSMDTAKIATSGPGGVGVLQGQAAYWDASPGTGASDLLAVYDGSGTGYISLSRLGGGSNVNPTAPITWANGDTINAEFFVPIAGWSSNTLISDSADTRVVAFNAANTSNQAVTASVTTLAFPNNVSDSHGAFSGTNTYIVPVPGDYVVNGIFVVIGTTTDIYVYLNGSSSVHLVGVANTSQAFNGSALLRNLKAGDAITLRASSNTTIAGSTDNCRLQIYRLSGPSQIAASEVIACRAYLSAGKSISTTNFSTIAYDVKLYDTHNTYNTSTGLFTCPSPGYYRVTAALGADATAAARHFEIRIIQNGTSATPPVGGTIQAIATGTKPSGTTSYRLNANGTATFLCNTGDTIQAAAAAHDTAFTSDFGSYNNSIMIERIGGVM